MASTDQDRMVEEIQKKIASLQQLALDSKRTGDLAQARRFMAQVVALRRQLSGEKEEDVESLCSLDSDMSSSPSSGGLELKKRMLLQMRQCQEALKFLKAVRDMNSASLFVQRMQAMDEDVKSLLTESANETDGFSGKVFVQRVVMPPKESLLIHPSCAEGVVQVSVCQPLKCSTPTAMSDSAGQMRRSRSLTQSLEDLSLSSQSDSNMIWVLSFTMDWAFGSDNARQCQEVEFEDPQLICEWPGAQWTGFIQDGIRSTKFIEHRKLKIQLWRRRPRSSIQSDTFQTTEIHHQETIENAESCFGSFSRFTSLFSMCWSNQSVQRQEDDAIVIEPKAPGTLIGQAHVELSSLLAFNERDIQVDLMDARNRRSSGWSFAIRLASFRPMSSKAFVERCKRLFSSRKWIMPCGGACERLFKPTSKPIVRYSDEDLDLICVSFVVMEEELVEEFSGEHPQRQFVQDRLDELVGEVESGVLDMMQYIDRVKMCIEAVNLRLASVENADEKKKWALRLQRMEQEVSEVG